MDQDGEVGSELAECTPSAANGLAVRMAGARTSSAESPVTGLYTANLVQTVARSSSAERRDGAGDVEIGTTTQVVLTLSAPRETSQSQAEMTQSRTVRVEPDNESIR